MGRCKTANFRKKKLPQKSLDIGVLPQIAQENINKIGFLKDTITLFCA